MKSKLPFIYTLGYQLIKSENLIKMQINGQTVGTNGLTRRDPIQIKSLVGSGGYANLEQALHMAEINSGSEVILQGPDKKFYTAALNSPLAFGTGNRDFITKNNQIQIEGKMYQVICFVDQKNLVLGQQDNDSKLENMQHVSQIRKNLKGHASSVNAVAFPSCQY